MTKKTTIKKSVKQIRLEHIDNLKDDFIHKGVEHESDHVKRCDNSCDSGICRCNIIENERVTEIDIEQISDRLVRKKDRNSMLHYCIERILVSEKLYDSDMWYIDIINSYYGQEINSVTVEISAPIINRLKQLVTMSNMQKINYVLTEEYGYLLPRLIAYNTALIYHAKTSNIIPSQNYYNKKVDASIYSGRSLPYCIVESGGGKFKIIDGHHRYAAALSDGLPFIPVILVK